MPDAVANRLVLLHYTASAAGGLNLEELMQAEIGRSFAGSVVPLGEELMLLNGQVLKLSIATFLVWSAPA